MHPSTVDLNEAQLALVSAARTRQPGALRALALSFDSQLAEEDVFLDGAVAAWQVVRVPRTRLGTM